MCCQVTRSISAAERDIDNIHKWRQLKAVDRCWVGVGVGAKGSSIYYYY